ncbi:NADH-quinone oxidoreductase subunit C [Desulfobacterales bacterium HSG16]|nr:NADH-quinone oxidoreductase subunit C [Desulfobacterales bacterium HSG16]
MNTRFLKIRNGAAISKEEIPNLPFDDFSRQAKDIVKNGGKVVHYFAYTAEDQIKLLCVLRTDALFVAATDAPESYPSLSNECEPFHMFEREIAEQYGIKPEGHPWLRMVRYHPNYTGKPDVFGNDYKEDIPGNYDYYSVAGDEVHEVAVGPVHAGVIEPGHFRFNCIGERVFNLEIQLGYQHRGVEQLLPSVPAKRLAVIAENNAGDTSIGNALCLSQAIESLTSTEIDDGAKIIRTIALELERLQNHVGDLGALSGDVAFLPPANYCGRMRGDFLNMSLLICGNRMGKGLVRPGGVRFELDDEIRIELIRRIDEIKPQVKHTIDLLFSTPSVISRFEGCGAVSRKNAEELGLVGPAGRACGIAYDARREFPNEHYGYLDIPENAEPTGDVYARSKVRADEIMQSIEIVQSLIENPIETNIVESNPVDSDNFDLAPDSFVVTINEAWRGELSHCIMTDENGKIERYKIKDPSFHNWNGLSMSLRDTGISDFPLNNKSFNLSYCGFDL